MRCSNEITGKGRKMDSKNKIKNNESKCQLSSMMEYTFSHFADEIAVDDNEKKYPT